MSLRIVSLAPSITETIFALNAQEYLVGVSDFCTYPDEANALDKIGGFNAPDLDKILALKPNLVIGTTMHQIDEMQSLINAEIEIKLVVAQKLFDAPNMVSEVGKIIGRSDQASKLTDSLNDQFHKILELASKIDKKRVCYLCTSVPFCGWKSKCQTNELVMKLGGELSRYEKDNLAQSIVDSDPEVIIIPYAKGNDDYKIQAKFFDDNPILKQTTAYKNNKVVQMNGELLSRPGPRAGEGLKQLFELIHN